MFSFYPLIIYAKSTLISLICYIIISQISLIRQYYAHIKSEFSLCFQTLLKDIFLVLKKGIFLLASNLKQFRYHSISFFRFHRHQIIWLSTTNLDKFLQTIQTHQRFWSCIFCYFNNCHSNEYFRSHLSIASNGRIKFLLQL